jgi:hypothetical protein
MTIAKKSNCTKSTKTMGGKTTKTTKYKKQLPKIQVQTTTPQQKKEYHKQ